MKKRTRGRRRVESEEENEEEKQEKEEEEGRTEDSRSVVYVDIRRGVYRQKEERTRRETERKGKKRVAS